MMAGTQGKEGVGARSAQLASPSTALLLAGNAGGGEGVGPGPTQWGREQARGAGENGGRGRSSVPARHS